MPPNTEKYNQADGLITLHLQSFILRRGEIATEGVKGEEASIPAEKIFDTDAVVAEMLPGVNSAKSAAEATSYGPDPAEDVSNRGVGICCYIREAISSKSFQVCYSGVHCSGLLSQVCRPF